MLKITITLMLISYSLSVSTEKQELKKKATDSQDAFGLKKVFEAITTLFLSGLFDRSFFITAFMAIKYSRCLVLCSAALALSLVGVISVFLGMAITKYIPTVWIDVFAVAMFMFFGVKMLLEGISMPANKDLINLQKESDKLAERQEDDAERLVSNGLPAISSHSHGLTHVLKDCEELTSDKPSNFKVFAKIFILIFASEIGDRSQISTIYLTNNFDKIVVLAASVIAQNLLTIVAIFGGVFISTRISERNLTLIAGTTFIAFGIVALYVLCVDDLLVLGKPLPPQQFISSGSITLSNEIIPDKHALMPNY
jgi:putative Ca2+/H+ antiporter (TMEM165/GDT1 family)